MTGNTFTVIGGSDTHQFTDWQILNDQLEVVWQSLSNASNKTTINVPFGNISELTTYTFRMRYKGTTYGYSLWNSIIAGTKEIIINTPTITIEGSPTEVPQMPTLTGSAFALNEQTDTHVSSDWQVWTGGNMIWSSTADTVNKTSITLPDYALSVATTYDFKLRYNGLRESPSDFGTATATTMDTFIISPDVEAELYDGYLVKEPTLTASEFQVSGGTDVHANTDWQILYGATVEWESLADSTNKTSIEVPLGVIDEGSKSYTIKVRYRGESGDVSSWRTIQATSPVTFPYEKFLITVGGSTTVKYHRLYGQDIDTFTNLSSTGLLNSYSKIFPASSLESIVTIKFTFLLYFIISAFLIFILKVSSVYSSTKFF
jgi:hypothetical protein